MTDQVDKAWLSYWNTADPQSKYKHINTINCLLPMDVCDAFKAGWEAKAKAGEHEPCQLARPEHECGCGETW